MDQLTSAKNFATRIHVMENHQWYGNILPYTHHLADVERVLIRFNYKEEFIRVAAWFHDAPEDTRGKNNEIKSRDIEELYGEEVANLVEAVTSEPGPNRKTRNALTYPKIRAAGPYAIALKLADRIANVEFGLDNDNKKMVDMYRKEYADFKHGIFVGPAMDERLALMWRHLDELMDPLMETKNFAKGSRV
jgi:(p)ppGpp synthase/HD superfamily hydrolase